MSTFFTADTHFGHANVIRFDSRPFDSIEDHDDALVGSWNSVVGPDDDVWHLGDFSFRNRMHVDRYLERLNGRIHLVRGNHDDKAAWRIRDRFASAQEAAYIKCEGQNIYLSHYGCRVWRNSCHGSWHLYGHSHGNLPPLGLSMDVGVHPASLLLHGMGRVSNLRDGYRPLSFGEVRESMGKEPPRPAYDEVVSRCKSLLDLCEAAARGEGVDASELDGARRFLGRAGPA
jgi:calcineurin-like phosphoesterase family protein